MKSRRQFLSALSPCAAGTGAAVPVVPVARVEAAPRRAVFVRRDACIACGSSDLRQLASGRFTDNPVRTFISDDPWAVNPLPYLEGETWELVECSACGQVAHARLLSAEWNERRFREWMGEAAIGALTFEHQWMGARQRIEHLLAIEVLTRGLRKSGRRPRLLDFGCGWGEFLAAARAAGFAAQGLDRDASRRGSTHVYPDLAAYDHESAGPLDAITLFQVLEHLPDPLSTLRDLRQRAAPGAVLVLETPDASGVKGIRTREDYLALHPLDHVNGFTPASLRAIALRAGWRAITPPGTYLTAEPWRLLRRAARGLVRRFRPTTSVYCVAC